jgi:hypothetical protein
MGPAFPLLDELDLDESSVVPRVEFADESFAVWFASEFDEPEEDLLESAEPLELAPD